MVTGSNPVRGVLRSEDSCKEQDVQLVAVNTFLEFRVRQGIVRCKSAPALYEGPSVGSSLHPRGCKPCAWFWKPGSCHNGAECRHCHLCPQGEQRRQKKLNKAKGNSERRSPMCEHVELMGHQALSHV
eukprot:s1789_g2.t1